MITRNICNVDAATLREKSFLTPGQQMVSRTVGNDQDFEQSGDEEQRDHGNAKS
jgi:hypothetical protein